MTTPLCNMLPEVYYRVAIPPGIASWYLEIAAICISLAVVTFGCWWCRGRTVRTTGSRTLLYASTGMICAAFVAGWVFAYDGDTHIDLGEAILVVLMPGLWAALGLIMCVFAWEPWNPSPAEPVE